METYEAILKRMLDKALSVSSNLDTREGSLVWYGSAPAAVELQNLYIALDTVLNETFADTASRPYLLLRAAERGLTPYSATPAVLELSVTPTALAVPLGTRFSVGLLVYAVTENRGNGRYAMTCETAGEVGNDTAGTVLPVEYLEGLERCTVTALLIPGEDEEDTEAFRKRYMGSLNSQSFGGNRADYLEAIAALPGVGGAKVYRAWNGDVQPTKLVPPEEADSWRKGLSNVPDTVKTWLDAVYDASQNGLLTVGGVVKVTVIDSTFVKPSESLIAQVQNALDPPENAGEGLGLAPIGHVVRVVGVEETAVHVSLSLSYQTGWTWGDVSASVEQALRAYFLELSKSWAEQDSSLVVRVSQIESRLLNLAGILDVADTKLNGQAGNLVLEADHLPVLGTVEVR